MQLQTSLVVQWLRICLPKQGHGFDPRCRKIPPALGEQSLCTTLRPCSRALKPQPLSSFFRACPGLLPYNKRSRCNEKPTHLGSSPCSLQLEKALVQQQRPSPAALPPLHQKKLKLKKHKKKGGSCCFYFPSPGLQPAINSVSPKAFQHCPSASSYCNQRVHEVGSGQAAYNQEAHSEQVKFQMPVKYVKGVVGCFHLESTVKA